MQERTVYLTFAASIFIGIFVGTALWVGSAVSANSIKDDMDDMLPGVFEMNVVGSPEIRFHVTFYHEEDGVFGVSQPAENRTYATGHFKSEERDDGIHVNLLDDHHYISGSSVTNIERHEWHMHIKPDGTLHANANIIVYDLNFNEQSRTNVDLTGKRLPEPEGFGDDDGEDD